MDNEQAKAVVAAKTYSRPRWKHFLRYGALAVIVFVDFGFVTSSIRAHFITHAEMTVSKLLRELFAYVLLVITNSLVLPRIIFEADRVDVDNDGVVFHNLLFRRRLAWHQIKAVNAPLYLKFAVIKTPKFFQLINKKDMPGFDELIETIQSKFAGKTQ